MFIFEKRTQMPVRINNKNPKLAGYILSQYGGAYNNLLQLLIKNRNFVLFSVKHDFFNYLPECDVFLGLGSFRREN